MNEDLLRTWVREHSLLSDSIVAAVILVFAAIRIWWWIRKTDLSKAKAALFETAHAHPATPVAAAPLSPRTARIAAFVFFSLGLIVIALAAMFSWNEYQWISAEVARARFVAVTRAGGTLTAQYQVQPSTRPPFIASFSFTPRGDRWAEGEDAMRADRVVEILPGAELRYREHQLSTGKDPQGWNLIKFIAALGAGFGGVLLFGAFKSRRLAAGG
jgi:hypothetical protein